MYIVSVPAMVFMMRRLGDHQWGEWSTALALILAVAILWNIGLRAVFIRRMSTNPEEKQQELEQAVKLAKTIGTLFSHLLSFGRRPRQRL